MWVYCRSFSLTNEPWQLVISNYTQIMSRQYEAWQYSPVQQYRWLHSVRPHTALHQQTASSVTLWMTAASITHSKKGSQYSITERMVPELIPVLGSQSAGDLNLAVGCHYFLPCPQLPLQPLKGLLPVLLLGEQRHDGC